MITAGKSKKAGILNKDAIENKDPAINRFLKLFFLEKIIIKLKIIGAIINSSALAIFPSRSGRVVNNPKMIVEILCRELFLGKRITDNFQKK